MPDDTPDPQAGRNALDDLRVAARNCRENDLAFEADMIEERADTLAGFVPGAEGPNRNANTQNMPMSDRIMMLAFFIMGVAGMLAIPASYLDFILPDYVVWWLVNGLMTVTIVIAVLFLTAFVSIAIYAVASAFLTVGREA